MVRNDELYTRWVQFGCFSPIFRFHNSGTPLADNRPWAKKPVYKDAAIQALKLRRALLPYLYTSAWKNRCGGLPLIRPMYHEHPKDNNAYKCPHQYYFGEDLITAPYDKKIGLRGVRASKKVWLPGLKNGNWYSLFSGKGYKGGRWYNIHGGINHIPVFARSGSIIPLELENGQGYEILLFNGKGFCDIYDDDGVTLKYKEGSYSLFTCKNEWQDKNIVFTMKQSGGKLIGKKEILLRIKGLHGFSRANARVNNRQSREVVIDSSGELKVEGIKFLGKPIRVILKLKK